MLCAVNLSPSSWLISLPVVTLTPYPDSSRPRLRLAPCVTCYTVELHCYACYAPRARIKTERLAASRD